MVGYLVDTSCTNVVIKSKLCKKDISPWSLLIYIQILLLFSLQEELGLMQGKGHLWIHLFIHLSIFF